ncbi:hypothetical protein EKO04_009940 [Ascochyta lentis]|uniref:Uncharacterized protein n=1 Tax=Ascochyta lentis TaxID=205686 RepID=A0A8H7IWX0_9PLEO|nr:hypothetical protein EKO04_009940 [Ascochyta lentis]
MSTISRREFSLQLDTAAPTPSATVSNASSTPTAPSNACSANSDCADGGLCSNGACATANQAAPFAPAGSLIIEPTTHLNTGMAIGIGVGVVVFVVLMVGIGFRFFRKRSRRQPIASPEAPPTTRDRSASTATKWTIDNDQRTLVASMPNSPQHAMFTAPPPGLPSDFYTTPGKVIDDEEKTHGGKEIAEYRQQNAVAQSNETPTSPVDKALPLPPHEEKRYAINVNINKSMIFDDIMFNAAAYAASPNSTPHERAPRYRFEEYLPPVPPSNPRISIKKSKDRASSTMSSEYELENYPHGSGYEESFRNSRSDTGSEYSDSEDLHPRDNALSKLEGSLSLPELPPPSPSLSFRSYDWYQDIIGGDQPAVEPSAPGLPIRNPARAVNPLFSHPPETDTGFVPGPPSPAFPSPVASSHLHPSSARLSHLPSPTSPNFRLSPTVYQMPGASHVSKLVPSLPSTRPVSEASTIPRYSHRYTHRYSRYASWMPEDDLEIPEDDLVPPQFPRYNSMVASIVQGSEATQTARTSARNSTRNSVGNWRSQSAPRPQSTMTQKSHYSRSWLPDDGLYLAEEGTEDSFEIFEGEKLASRSTSYSPLA